MRLIDADELIKCIPLEEYNSRFAIMNAPTVELQKWIPCSERLPNEHERMKTYIHLDHASSFIVTIKGANIPTVLYLTDDNYWKDKNGHYYSVSAWMELPEVYREEE